MPAKSQNSAGGASCGESGLKGCFPAAVVDENSDDRDQSGDQCVLECLHAGLIVNEFLNAVHLVLL